MPWTPPAPTPTSAAAALVPWICDALLSNHSVKAYGRDFLDFVRHMQAQGVAPLEVTADHVKLYKRALLEAGMATATVARRLSVLRGAYQQLAAKGLISWETAQDIAAIKAAGVQKNSTPSLTQRQAVALLEAIPTDTLQGIRDLAMMSVFFLTGCRVSAVTGACVGHLETDGVEHYLHVTEKRNKKRRKILLDAARPVLAYVERAGIQEDREGPLFRPMTPDATRLIRRHLDRKTPWRLVKKYCRGRRHRPRPAGRPRHRHPLAAQDGDQRRHPQRGRRCTRCANSPATATSAPPRSTSSARRKTPRWPPAASRSASRGPGRARPPDPRLRRIRPWTTCSPSPSRRTTPRKTTTAIMRSPSAATCTTTGRWRSATGERGKAAASCAYASPQPEEMKAVIRDRLRRRLSAPKRIGCPYRLSAFSAAPGFDASAWLPGDVMARFFQPA